MCISKKHALTALFAVTSVATMSIAHAGGCGGSRSYRGYSSHVSRSYGHSYGHVSHGYSHRVQPAIRHVSSQPIVQRQVQGIRPVQPISQPTPQRVVSGSQPLQPVSQPRTLTNAPAPTGGSQPLRPVAGSPQPSTVAPTPAAPVNPTPQPANPQMSALRALGAFAPAAPVTPAAPGQNTPNTVASYVGSWTASLGNGATVNLTLAADGQFKWTATSNGNTSSFSGQYSVEGGNLNLTRSNDNVQLIGAMQLEADGFSFKVNGANAAALTFTRN